MDQLINPIFGFRLALDGEDISAVIESHGENGETVELHFGNDFDLLKTGLAFKTISEILCYAQEFGLEDAVEKYGEKYGFKLDSPEAHASVNLWDEFNQ